MDAGPQRRLLDVQPGAAVPAGDHGPDLRPPGHQRRGATGVVDLTAALDPSHDRGAQAEPGVRPRHLGGPRRVQSQRPVVRPRVRRRHRAVRQQPVPIPTAGRARPAPLGGVDAGRAARHGALPADRRAAVLPHARRPRLLLVPPDPSGRRSLMSAPAVPGREPLDLTSYLGHQRWFAGKGRPWQVTGTATVGRPSADVRIDTVTVTYDDGDTETYQLPLVAYDTAQEHLAHAYVGEEAGAEGGPRHLYDALHDKDATVHWIGGIAGDLTMPGLSFHRDPSLDELPEAGPSIVVGAEQSNTSVIFGDTVILKVFRKVSPGVNPD